MKAYLKELRKQAGRDIDKSAESLVARMESEKKKLLGFERDEHKTVTPIPPVTTASIFSHTRLPTSVPKYELTLLPNAKISPTVGIGLGGIQTRMVIKRRPDQVPKDSIIGAGLDNQKTPGGGAHVDVGVKTALMNSAMKLPIAGLLGGTALGAGLGAVGGREGHRGSAALAGAVAGGAVGAGGGAMAKHLIEKGNAADKIRTGRRIIDANWADLLGTR